MPHSKNITQKPAPAFYTPGRAFHLSICTKSIGDKGHQCDLTGALNRRRQLSLMLRAGAGHTPGQDLRPLGHIPTQPRHILVINTINEGNAYAIIPKHDYETRSENDEAFKKLLAQVE